MPSRTTRQTSRPAKRASQRSAVVEELEKLVRRPAGKTLTALAALPFPLPHFGGLRGAKGVAPALRKQLLRRAGLIVLGEAASGLFGVHREQLGETIDDSPVVYSDRQGLPPELVGRDLAEFLSIWAYVPDFFDLSAATADELDSMHDEQLGKRRGTTAARTAVQLVVGVPGVSQLSSGRDVRKRLNALLPMSNALWPDEQRAPISPTVTRAKLDAAYRKWVTDLTKPRPGEDDDSGQSFEETRARIKEIEARAIAKIAALRDSTHGRLAGPGSRRRSAD